MGEICFFLLFFLLVSLITKSAAAMFPKIDGTKYTGGADKTGGLCQAMKTDFFSVPYLTWN